MNITDSAISLFENGKYSDLTVICGETTYRVHRAVLCSRSQFFAKACDGPFPVSRRSMPSWPATTNVPQEAQTGIINLSDADPQAVRLMLHYFYHLDYPHVGLHQPGAETPEGTSIVPEQGEASLAEQPDDHFAWRSLRSGKSKKRPAKKKPAWESPGDEAGLSDTTTQRREPNLIIHANIYALGEQYAVEGLKSVALTKFSDEAKLHWMSEDFKQPKLSIPPLRTMIAA